VSHRHKWLLGSLRACRTRRVALVKYLCACGKRRTERRATDLAVRTARWMEEKKVEER
jgi:hypothetical protein